MGTGLALDAPWSLPLPSMTPISVADVGAVAPVAPTLAFDPPPPVIFTLSDPATDVRGLPAVSSIWTSPPAPPPNGTYSTLVAISYLTVGAECSLPFECILSHHSFAVITNSRGKVAGYLYFNRLC